MKKRRRMESLEVVDEGYACVMVARMLGQASSLRRAAEILDSHMRNEAAQDRNREDFSAALRGAPILRAQSAEIALKALWRIGHKEKLGEPPRDHDLTELHDALPETIRELLAEEFPEIPDPFRPHSLIPARKGLGTILDEHATALVEWRYAYERSSLAFENVFDEVLDTLIAVGWRLHHQWLMRLRKQDARQPRGSRDSTGE